MSREIEEQVQHDHIVVVLYKEYYNYPSVQHPHLLSFANHPFKSRGVKDEQGNELFPDLVVLEVDTDKLVMVAEVETASTVTQEEAKEWSRFSSLGVRFYLYVPRGLAGVAGVLCRGMNLTELVEYHHENNRYIMKRYR